VKLLYFALLLAVCLAPTQEKSVAENSVAASIYQVTVINVGYSSEVEDQTVTIRGNRIASVAATQDSDNSLSNSIDARGAFLIPGLWDMHVHVHDVNELPLYIANGAIEPGKIANLVLLRADPLADIHNSTQIQAVWLQGKYFDQAALAHLLEAAKQ
jgi:imidazolonepropionase-like amidohydrolase